MLRITITDTASEQKWILQGQLTGPWADQLRSNWDETRRARQGRRCLVDANDLTFIDQSGESVLRTMMSEGAKFTACGVCTKHVLKSLWRGCKKKPSSGSSADHVRSDDSLANATRDPDRNDP